MISELPSSREIDPRPTQVRTPLLHPPFNAGFEVALLSGKGVGLGTGRIITSDLKLLQGLEVVGARGHLSVALGAGAVEVAFVAGHFTAWFAPERFSD